MGRSSPKIPAERRRFFGFDGGSWRPWRRRGAELATAVGEAFVAWRLPRKRAISPPVTLVTSSRQAAVLPSDKLIDGELLRADVLGLAGNRGELTQPARAAIVVRLKRALAEGRAEAERRLRQDGHGTFCAGRL